MFSTTDTRWVWEQQRLCSIWFWRGARVGVWLLFRVFGWFLWGFGMCVCVWPRPVPGFPPVLLGFVLACGLFGLLKPVRTVLPIGVSLFDFTFYSGISSQYHMCCVFFCVSFLCWLYEHERGARLTRMGCFGLFFCFFVYFFVACCIKVLFKKTWID